MSDGQVLEPLLSRRGDGGHCGLWRVALALGVVANGAFLFGYYLAAINGPLPQIAADLKVDNNPQLQGLIVSSLLAGGAVGSILGSGLADKFGRRRSLMVACIPLLIGEALMVCAMNYWTMVAGRVSVGIGIGLSSSLVPVYISEVSPTHLRGLLGTFNQLTITVGCLAALVVNELLPAERWRWVMAMGVLQTFCLLLGMALVCPESPRWLVHEGHHGEAAEAAEWLWGAGAGEMLEQDMEDVEGSVCRRTGAGGGSAVLDMFAPANRRVAFIAVMVFVLQQYAGINALVYFSTDIFKQAGVTSANLASVLVGCCNIGVTIISANLMDRLGRRQLLRGSFIGMGASMATMCVFMSVPALQGVSGIVAVVGALTYIVSFAMGAGPVPMLFIPEIAPHHIRGRAVALAMTSHWVNNVVVGQLFLPAVQLMGVASVYGFFATVCFCGAVFASLYVVETKGRSLEEIEAVMNCGRRVSA